MRRPDISESTPLSLPVSTVSLAQGGPLLAALSQQGAQGTATLSFPAFLAAAAAGSSGGVLGLWRVRN